MTNKKKLSFVFIILAGIGWGTSPIFVHYLAPYGFTSQQMTAVRGTVSFICMLLYVLISNRKLFKIRFKDFILCAFVGATLFGSAFCYYTAMQMTSASTAVVLMYTAPIYVMLFSVLFLGERFSKGKVVALIMRLLGCCLVSGIITGLKFNVWGILVGILTSFVYAAYNILTKVSMQRKLNAITVTLYSFMFMCIIALSICKPLDLIENIASAPMPTIPLCVGLAVATFVLPFFLFTWSMKYLPAGIASALSVVEPMAATVFSAVLFLEIPDIPSIIGILLILAAVYLLGRSE
ncbi:MAG: DMT family transporter [Clostridia bacterium]|nr:DMT family transporter [Clostridia bacterium]